MTAVTQIKRDAEQTTVVNQNNVKHLEEKFEIAKKESKEAPEIITQSIKQIHQVALSNAKTVEFIQDRISYLRHVIIANRNDTHKFLKELDYIHKTKNKHRDTYQKDIQVQKFDQQEMENDLRVKISASINQLKGLSFLRDIREQLVEQTISVKQLIEEEKVLNSNDLTSIRGQIFDQREFYENDLKTRLAAAKKFAKDFSDLHVDLVVRKIMNETAQNRQKLNEISSKTIEVLRDNDVLRKKYNILNQKYKLRQTTFENLQNDYDQLKLTVADYEDKEFDTLQAHKKNLQKFLDEKEETVFLLEQRKEEGLQKRDKLKQELSAIHRELQKIETIRSEESQKEYELLDQMNQTATFILTAIDKSMIIDDDENERTKSPRYLKPKKNRTQKSELSKLMLKLQKISKQMKEDSISFHCTLKNLEIEKVDIEVQTDPIENKDDNQPETLNDEQSKPINDDQPVPLNDEQSKTLSDEQSKPINDDQPGPLNDEQSKTLSDERPEPLNVQPPSLLESTQSPRRKTALPISRRAPALISSTRTSLSKKRSTITRPVHV